MKNCSYFDVDADIQKNGDASSFIFYVIPTLDVTSLLFIRSMQLVKKGVSLFKALETNTHVNYVERASSKHATHH